MKEKTPITKSNQGLQNASDKVNSNPSDVKFKQLSEREKRLLKALERGALMREQLDRAAKTSNSPDVIFRLRKLGLEIPCHRIKKIDSDGRTVHPGRYVLTSGDRAVIHEWRQEVDYEC